MKQVVGLSAVSANTFSTNSLKCLKQLLASNYSYDHLN